MTFTHRSRRDTWVDVDNSVWDPPSKVWSALDPSIRPCPGVSALGSTLTYALIPGPAPQFALNGTGVQIFGYAWVSSTARAPAFPTLLPFIDDATPLTVVWALAQPLNAACMPFSITASSLGPPPHKLSITWEKQDGVLQEAILTHVLQASDVAAPPGSPSQGPGSTGLRGGESGPTTIAAASPSPSTPAGQSSQSTLLIVAIVAPTTLVAVLALVALVLYKRANDRKQHAKHVNPFTDPGHQIQQMAMQALGHAQSARRTQVTASSTDVSSSGGTMPYREHLVPANLDATVPITGKQRAFAAFQQWSAPARQSVESGIPQPVSAPSLDDDQVTVAAQIRNESADARPPSMKAASGLPRYEK